MAAASSNSSTSPVQAQNSPRSRHSRRSSAAAAARGNPSPAENSPPHLSLSPEIVDQETFGGGGTPPSSTTTASFEANNTVLSESGYLGDDGSLLAPGGGGGDGGVVDNSENGGSGKKAWNKPSNVAAAAEVVSAVMGAESWPALSESARASPKSPSTYAAKSPTHGSISATQEMAVGPVTSPKKLSTNMSSSSSAAPARQKSMKRGGSGLSHSSIAANGSLAPGSPTAGTVTDEAHSAPGKSGTPVGEFPRDNVQRDAGTGRKGGSHGGGDQQHRGSFRRNNSGSFSRGDGSYHHSNGGRRDRDQDRGKQDWGNSPHSRSFGRESQAPHQRGVASPQNAPFIPPPPVVLPFPPMVYTDMPTPVYYVPGPLPESVRPIPMVQLSPVYLPMPDPNLASKIVNQIDYYFSNENLVKDTFLRRNMDNEGWVSINLIAGFKKVMQLTDNIQIILDAIQASNVVEVQGDKLRRKNDWNKWIMPLVQSPQSSNESNLPARVNNITLE